MSLFAFPVVSFLSQVVVVLALAPVYAKLTLSMKLLGAYFIVSLILGILQIALALNHIDNRWTSEFFLPIQFTLLLVVFYLAFEDWRFRQVLAGCLLLLLVFFAVTIAWMGVSSRSYAYVKAESSLVLVAVSCYVLVWASRNEETPISAHPMFWVASANVVYFAGTAVLYALSGAIFEAPIDTMRLVWSIQSVVNVVANVIYLRAFLCFRRKWTYSGS